MAGPPAGKGYCEETCNKDCASDSDCETSQGDLCCDLGSAGKACLPAKSCPKHCSGDANCDAKNGEVCAAVSLSVSDKLCVAPAAALHTCSADSNCDTGQVCCGIYGQSVCMAPSACPKSCAVSNECDTSNGEICCTTVKLAEPSLSVSGLCLNPNFRELSD